MQEMRVSLNSGALFIMQFVRFFVYAFSILYTYITFLSLSLFSQERALAHTNTDPKTYTQHTITHSHNPNT